VYTLAIGLPVLLKIYANRFLRKVGSERQHQEHDFRCELYCFLSEPINNAGTRRHHRDRHADRRRLQTPTAGAVKHGDVVEVEIERIGRLANPVHDWNGIETRRSDANQIRGKRE
jgi:hypothetical protein